VTLKASFQVSFSPPLSSILPSHPRFYFSRILFTRPRSVWNNRFRKKKKNHSKYLNKAFTFDTLALYVHSKPPPHTSTKAIHPEINRKRSKNIKQNNNKVKSQEIFLLLFLRI
jgi:hypothetical protein